MPDDYLSIAAIFKDEAPYLQEWVDFHRLVGVQRFYLYDNDSSDGGAEVLAPYIASGLVEYATISGGPAQMDAYMHALRMWGDQTRWMAFIDIDEFLFSPTMVTLDKCLEAFESFPAVGVNWLVYGTGGHTEPPDELVTLSYHLRTTNDQLNKHVKSIVQPDQVLPIQPPDPHHFIYSTGQAVNERFRPFRGPFSEPPVHELFRLNHYWSKSEQEARAKADKARADNGMTRNIDQLLDPELNELRDDAIVPWALELPGAIAR